MSADRDRGADDGPGGGVHLRASYRVSRFRDHAAGRRVAGTRRVAAVTPRPARPPRGALAVRRGPSGVPWGGRRQEDRES